METHLRNIYTKRELNPTTRRPVRAEKLQHPPKVKYFPNNSVPKLVIRRVGDTAYDYYIAETLYPLKSAIKLRKETRFTGDPVSSVKTIPARRTRSHPPKWTIEAEDPDLMIPIECHSSGQIVT